MVSFCICFCMHVRPDVWCRVMAATWCTWAVQGTYVHVPSEYSSLPHSPTPFPFQMCFHLLFLSLSPCPFFPTFLCVASSTDGTGASRSVPEVNEPPRDIPIPRLVKYLPRFLLNYRIFRHSWEFRRVIASDLAYNSRFKYTVSFVEGMHTHKHT